MLALRYACAVSSCTAALHLALLAVGVRPGDEVITVSHSFIATANAIRYCGAKPVFVDIDGQSCDIGSVPTGSGRNTANAGNHAGSPDGTAVRSAEDSCNRPPSRIAPVVEDAACASGSEILIDGKWDHIGKPHGDIACFSFHPRKVITTGDGGMLTTSELWY